MLSQAEFDALLQRYLAGQSRPGERQLVEGWSKQLGAEENLQLPPHWQVEVKAAVWQRIARLTEAATPPAAAATSQAVPQALPLWRRPVLRWAAVLVLALGAGWWLPRPHTAPVATHWVRQHNATRHAQQLLLADGSRVTLAAGSTLHYSANLAGIRREVYLTGEAFFKVTKNPARPFLVYTDKLITTVLGTSFRVTANAGQPGRVAVCEGRVAVQPRVGAQLSATPTQPAPAGVLLLPNQQVTYSAAAGQRLTKELVEKPIVLAPQVLTFKNQPVPEVLAALEKAYGVNIVYDPQKLRGCTITIDFEDEPLFEQLQTLCKALDANYKLANNAQIIFETNGCKAG